MAERSIESVSALMDGEVADFELRRVLERMDQEPECKILGSATTHCAR